MPPGTKIFDFGWVADNLDTIAVRIGQHLMLTIIPLLLGIVVAMVLAIIALRKPRTYSPVTAITGLLYTIPSLAAFAILRPIFGLSLITAFIPLMTYTLLILFRNFTAGFYAVPAEILEAAEGMGYTRRERLLRVELPLSVPLIIAGIRLASVTVIGLATVAAVLGDQIRGSRPADHRGHPDVLPHQVPVGCRPVGRPRLQRGLPVCPAREGRPAMGPRQGWSSLMDGVLGFFQDPANWTGTTGIPNRLFEHLVICALAVFIAALIAIPTGLYIGHTNRASGVAINFANVGRAIRPTR